MAGAAASTAPGSKRTPAAARRLTARAAGATSLASKLLAHARPDKLERTLQSLLAVRQVDRSQVFVVQDGKDRAVEALVRELGLKHVRARPAPSADNGAAKVAAAYKWALSHAFDFLTRDEALVDALFVVAAAMSKQPGAVTLEAFKQLPPIQSLRGELPDDLSDAEIADAWAEAGLAVGAAADKTAFTRAWLALDQLYDDDMMVEARRPPKKTRAPDV